MSQMAAGEFKAKCLHVLDQVQLTKEPVIVTKRGKPVARVVPMPSPPESLYGIAKGSMQYAADDDLLSTGEVWDAEH